jgi:hypothetical protein
VITWRVIDNIHAGIEDEAIQRNPTIIALTSLFTANGELP